MGEEMIRESPFYKAIEQRGIEKGIDKGYNQGFIKGFDQGVKQGINRGARETSTKNILSVLTTRFPQSDLQPVSQVLETIVDIDRLTELHRRAVHTPSVEAFLQTLNGSEK